MSWKESQRQLLVTLLNSPRAVQAAMCAYEYNPVDNDEDAGKIIKAAVVEEEMLLQKKKRAKICESSPPPHGGIQVELVNAFIVVCTIFCHLIKITTLQQMM